MQPRIETLSEKKLIGKHLTMTFANNQTFKLWQSFMPKRKEITNNLTSDLFSIQTYPSSFDFTFSDPHTEFEKWAAIEVSNDQIIPNDMETYTLIGGLYAVFLYKGLSTDTRIFQYIYGQWLQNSKYSIDNRPHFEILGANYKNNDPSSEEEIWIPIKLKE